MNSTEAYFLIHTKLPNPQGRPCLHPTSGGIFYAPICPVADGKEEEDKKQITGRDTPFLGSGCLNDLLPPY